MEINQTVIEVGANAKLKGFWDKERNIGEMLMLITSELGEALEAHRKGKKADLEGYHQRLMQVLASYNTNIHPLDRPHRDVFAQETVKKTFETYIKDSFEDEMADAVIRIFDTCAYLNIDLEKHIELKMKYNQTREKMHGKKY